MGIYDLMQGIQQQGEEGRKRGLASLVGKAYGAPQDQRQQILATVAQRGAPDMAYNAQAQFEKMDDNARQRLGQYALAFDALPDEQKAQAYPQFAQQAQALGIPAPAQWDPTFAPNIQKLAQALGGAGQSASLQEFGAMTAGMSPDDVARARRINLGLDPRAVTGAMKFDTFSGRDGRPRPQKNNPTTGQVEIFYDEMGQWVPLGGGAGGAPAPQQAAPTKVDMEGDIQLANDLIASGIPAERVDAFLASRGQRAEAGVPAQGAAPVAGSGLGVGRSPEEEAFAKETATQAAQIGALPQRGVIEAQNAGLKEQATADVQSHTAGGIEANKQFGKDAAARFEQITQRGAIAENENRQLVALRDLLSKTYTGSGAGAVLGAKRAAAAVGISVSGLGEAEAARAISNKLALSLRNPAGGEGMPGQMSDRDLSFLKESIPSLENSPQGWRAMVNIKIALNAAAVKQARVAEQLRQQGVPIQEIPGRLKQFANDNPVFSGSKQESATPQSGRVLRYNPATGKIE